MSTRRFDEVGAIQVGGSHPAVPRRLDVVVAALLVVLASASACTTSRETAGRVASSAAQQSSAKSSGSATAMPTRPTSAGSATGTFPPGLPPSSGSGATTSAARFCMLARPPAALTTLLTRGVVHWPEGVLGFNGVLADGTIVANTKQSLVLLTPGKQVRTIYRDSRSGAFSFVQELSETNGYLVFRVTYNNQTNTDWEMVEANLVTGATHVIGRPEPGISDDLTSIAPTAGGGYAAWSQARADRSLEVQVADVATGVTRRVPWRNIAFPRIVDGVLLAVAHPSGNWQEPTGDRLVAFDLHTLARVPLPAGLSDVSEPRNLEVTPGGVLWSTTDYTTIHAISATNPHLLLTANGTTKGFSAEDWPYLSDNGFAGWYQNGGGPGSGVFADLQTGVAVPLANHIYIAGTTVVAETIANNTVNDSVFSTTDLPRLTGCSPSPMPAQPPPSAAPALSPLDTTTATKP